MNECLLLIIIHLNIEFAILFNAKPKIYVFIEKSTLTFR